MLTAQNMKSNKLIKLKNLKLKMYVIWMLVYINVRFVGCAKIQNLNMNKSQYDQIKYPEVQIEPLRFESVKPAGEWLLKDFAPKIRATMKGIRRLASQPSDIGNAYSVHFEKTLHEAANNIGLGITVRQKKALALGTNISDCVSDKVEQIRALPDTVKAVPELCIKLKILDVKHLIEEIMVKVQAIENHIHDLEKEVEICRQISYKGVACAAGLTYDINSALGNNKQRFTAFAAKIAEHVHNMETVLLPSCTDGEVMGLTKMGNAKLNDVISCVSVKYPQVKHLFVKKPQILNDATTIRLSTCLFLTTTFLHFVVTVSK